MSQLYLGTQGWSYSSWVGSFYPSGTPTTAFLPEYAKTFNTVELDTTFYGVPKKSTIAGWKERTPIGFRFAAKFPKEITHEKALQDTGLETKVFLEAMAGLDEKLGPMVLQMPPQWSAAAMADLKKYLLDLPADFQYVLEVRHKSWLVKETFDQLTELLRSRGVALCLVQHAWMPALDTVTAPFTYVRWLGRREDIPDDDFSHIRINRDVQLDRWAEQISRYLHEGLVVYGYFNNHYQGHSPASVAALQKRLNASNAGEGVAPL